jgi:ubiquinone/menaquinone biosynthesis C-methylase UbiE
MPRRRSMPSAFDAGAARFERQRALPPGAATAIHAAVLAGLFATRPRLLDLGAGTGRIGWPFVAAGDDYVGVDLSIGMLRAFATRPGLRPERGLFLAQADGPHLPFPDASFDAVLMMQVLSAAGDWRSLLAESARVLRHSGSLIVGRTMAPEDGIDARMKQRLDEILEAMGVQPYRKQATDDALAWLSHIAQTRWSVVAASWMTERAPRHFVERHGGGARFSALPAPVRDAALRHVSDWAAGSFGSLDATFSEAFRYELSFFHPGTPH